MVEEIVNNMSYTRAEFKRSYLLIIGSFYAGQGFALGSMVLLIPLYLLNILQVGSRSTAISIAAMIVFPWYVKFIFGMITDNFPINSHRRKPYLIIATFFSLIGWYTIGLSSSVYPFFFLSGVSLAIGSALGDAVIDGQAIEITPENYAGRLQGVNWGSRGLGIGMAGYFSPNIVNILGWNWLFLIAGTIAVAITLIALLLPEPDHESTELSSIETLKAMFIQLKIVFTKPRMISRVLFILFSGFTLAIVLQITLIMETEFGYDYELIGYGALSFAFGTFVGAVTNGIISDKDDSFQGFVGLSIAYASIIMAGVVFIDYRNFQAELLFFCFIGVFGGAYEAYQLKVIQEETIENIESTIFSIYTGISNVGQFAMGGILIVFLADTYNISILLSMQVILIFLILAAYYLKVLKFDN